MNHTTSLLHTMVLLIGTLLLSAPIAAESSSPSSAAGGLRCPGTVTLAFSPAFTLCLPLTYYRDAFIISGDDILVKREADSFFFGKIVTPAQHGLPGDFDMRAYPRLLLGLASLDEWPADVARKIFIAREALFGMPTVPKPVVHADETKVIYLVGNESRTLAFVVKADQSEQLLYLGFDGVPADDQAVVLRALR